MKRTVGVLLLILAAVGLTGAGASALGPGTTDLVSVSSAGVAGNGSSNSVSISADGRYVAFHSDATNLVSGDTNGRSDVFVRDRVAAQTDLVSVGVGGAPANSYSFWPSISADGRYVAFQSYAGNLVAGDTNGAADIFVRDRVAGTTERVSIPSSGQPNGNSNSPSISADGRYVAFVSDASNLVDNDTNDSTDVFVYDRQSHSLQRASISGSGAEGNDSSDRAVISAEGSYVAFQSYASNLVPSDTNRSADIFVRDRVAGTTERVSAPSGGQTNGHSYWPSLSADGRYVAFQSYASNLVGSDTNNAYDVFVFDRQSHSTERVSLSSSGLQGDGPSERPTLSADGRFVAFQSAAKGLVAGDGNGKLDVFVRDRTMGTTERASVSGSGAEGNGDSYWPSLNSDGRQVGFVSLAGNLASGDNRSTYDVFVRDRAVLDTTPPTTTSLLLGTVGKNGWYTSEVRVALTATDEGGSGVKEIHYVLNNAPEVIAPGATTSFLVPTEGSHSVVNFAKDNAGNAEAARSTTVKLDETAPGITIVTPKSASYLLNQSVQANYSVADGVSGVALSSGTVPSGSNLDTASPGAKQFAVKATDNAGNSAGQEVSYQVAYGVRLLSEEPQAANGGSTIPLKLQLVDANGVNKSAPGVVLTAQAISPGGVLNDAGKANPGNDFRYDSTLGDTGGYVFNLSTKDLAPGSYSLSFTVADDPASHAVQFRVK